jgi:hypothetical protein
MKRSCDISSGFKTYIELFCGCDSFVKADVSQTVDLCSIRKSYDSGVLRAMFTSWWAIAARLQNATITSSADHAPECNFSNRLVASSQAVISNSRLERIPESSGIFDTSLVFGATRPSGKSQSLGILASLSIWAV